ncbi:Hypp7711 [Branchiostoma lanceolatum]|uniref:Hypp7711 protein n=1 Tax=Branchiostoma lanceolatum TaxID=7740 RepID=A0A8J9Z2D1_BRALA|nr:Hypp7711 [Branchiostoma lanceolatum]
MQHPSLFLSIVCLLFAFAARPVALRRLARSVLRHRGLLICSDGTYFSKATRSCEPCSELCQPQRGTQRECELRCKDVGFTIWQIAEVTAFGVIVAALAVLGYCNFQKGKQIQKLWMMQNPDFSPGPATLPQQQPPSVHVAVSTPLGVPTAMPPVVSVGQQAQAAPGQPPYAWPLPQERPSLPVMDTAGERTAPSNTVPIYATDTKPHVHNVQNDLVEEDHAADRQMTRQETEI